MIGLELKEIGGRDLEQIGRHTRSVFSDAAVTLHSLCEVDIHLGTLSDTWSQRGLRVPRAGCRGVARLPSSTFSVELEP